MEGQPPTVSPNPAVNRIVFKNRIAVSGLVQIDVYAIDGRRVASPFCGSVESGKFEYTWDIHTELPNGVYLVQFRTGTDLQTQKLLLMR